MTEFEILLQSQQNVKVLHESDFAKIDLSATNKNLSQIQTGNAFLFEQYIENYLSEKNASVAFGGYNERRWLYQRSTIFNSADTDERNIHIGLDLWLKAGTPVLAALDGTLHSFANNIGIGNYGPTIIPEHTVDAQTFYTLYGHLSLESIINIKVGDKFDKGHPIATLGEASVNGDYAPHLHFQVIKNIGEYRGDYPGVCAEKDLPFYLENCPDPNILLKINEK